MRTWILLTVVALAPARAFAQGGLDPVAERVVEAQRAAARGEPEAALELLRAAAAESPEEPGVSLALGRLLVDVGRADEALAVLTPARARAPRSAWLATEVGRAHALRGDAAAAEDALRAALEAYPACGAARVHLATLLARGGRGAEAEAVLAPLAAGAPDHPAVVVARAEVASAQGRGDEAEAVLRAGADDPAVRRAWCDRLARAGRDAEAWEVGRPLADGLAAAGDAQGLVQLARLARRADHGVDALALLGAALLVDPGHDAALAELCEVLEDDAPALRVGVTRRWTEAHPGDVHAWREALEADLDAGHLDAFFERLARVPAAARASVPVRLVEGEALRRAGRAEEARLVLESLCTADDVPRAWYELALLEYAEGAADAAAEAFARGAADAWAADAHFNRGICLDRLGRAREAVAAYERALEARPRFPEAWLQLGTDYRYRLGDAHRAREAYRHYLEQGGDDPEVRRFVEEGR